MSTEVALEPLVRALDLFGDLVAAVGPDQWSLPTPCEAWTARELVDHVAASQHRLAASLRGEPPAPSSPDSSPDPSPSDPARAFRSSAEELLAAFGEPGALDRLVTIPAGTLPGRLALHLRATEALVHGWDLAQATGLRFDVPEDLAATELAFSGPMLERVPPERRRFAPPQPVDDDAPAIDRLVALLGRRPARP